MRFNHQLVWGNLQVIVCENELALKDLDVVVGRVLDHNVLGDLLTDWRNQLELFNFLRLFNVHDKVVEDVLSRGLLHKSDTELIGTCF